MTIASTPSRIILEVERAMSDLRRGASVALSDEKGSVQHIAAAEFFPEESNHATHPMAIRLMKLAGLLPMAVAMPAPADYEPLRISAEAIQHYPDSMATAMVKVSEARVPLKNASETKVIAFRPRFGHDEHLAVVVGDLTGKEAPLVRVHSSCVTGDILGSLRCDCGNQLQKALELMAAEGGGVLLYLNQEGRGIGIANKLRAYGLQDQGMDTVDANLALGFAADERSFGIAASILRVLNIPAITLLTNNPLKVKAMECLGIKVRQRRPVTTEPNAHNQGYLDTKAKRMGHNYGGSEG